MANIHYKQNGEYKDIVVKVGDTLPIGAIIGFDTTGTIPDGWEYYAENQIKKIAPVTPANGNIKNSYGISQTDTYSQEYINKFTDYSTTEQVVGKWIDGKPIYKITSILQDITEANIEVGRTIAVDNIDTILDFNGFILSLVDNTKRFRVLNYYNSLNQQNVLCAPSISSSGRIQFNIRSSWTGTPYITVYYTKTTD